MHQSKEKNCVSVYTLKQTVIHTARHGTAQHGTAQTKHCVVQARTAEHTCRLDVKGYRFSNQLQR